MYVWILVIIFSKKNPQEIQCMMLEIHALAWDRRNNIPWLTG